MGNRSCRAGRDLIARMFCLRRARRRVARVSHLPRRFCYGCARAVVSPMCPGQQRAPRGGAQAWFRGCLGRRAPAGGGRVSRAEWAEARRIV